MNFYNNIFIAKAPQSSGQYAAFFNSVVNNLTLVANSDSNYYACPISDSLTLQVSQPSLYGNYNYLMTLSSWQSFSGQDKHSKKSPEKITSLNDLQYYYNPTNVISTIPLSQPMIDIRGTKYGYNIMLLPYSSVVLMKDYNPAKYYTTELISICDSSNYDGWSTSGTYNQYLKSISGADSVVTIYLNVNPNYSIYQNIQINSGENYLGWTTTGIYRRNLKTIYGCDSTVITSLVVLNPNNIQVIKIYPNPNNGVFTISFSKLPNNEGNIKFYNISGSQIASTPITKYFEEFNFYSLSPGIYLIKTTVDSLNQTFKMVIQ